MTQLTSWPSVTDSVDGLSGGTALDLALTNAMKSAIEALVHSTTNTTVSPKNAIDELVLARRNKSTLLALLSVSLDADGLLKSPLPSTLVETFGAGTGTGPVSGRIGSSGTSVGDAGSFGDLHLITIPANTLDADGDTLLIISFLHLATNGNTKTLGMYFGGDSMGSTTTTESNKSVMYLAAVKRTGASTQVGALLILVSGQSPVLVLSSLTRSLASANDARVMGGGTSANDVTAKQTTMLVL